MVEVTRRQAILGTVSVGAVPVAGCVNPADSDPIHTVVDRGPTDRCRGSILHSTFDRYQAELFLPLMITNRLSLFKSCFDCPQACYGDEINAIPMNRRKLLQLTGTCLAFTVTGCLGTDPPQDTESDQSENGSSGIDANAEAAQTPDPDHSIQIKNERSDPVNVTATVVRETTGETVHNQTYTLQPDETNTAYNTRQANPDGIEKFNVSVTSGGSTDSFTLETDQCMGHLTAQVTESDGIDMLYSIC